MLDILGVKDQREASCSLYVPDKSYSAFEKVARMVQDMAPEYELDPDLVLALIEKESRFKPKARSHRGAKGLMQLMSGTAKDFGVKDVWDLEQNLKGGMAYLRWLLDHLEGKVELALAAYNAGLANVRRHGGIPPFPETQAYVKYILKRIGREVDASIVWIGKIYKFHESTESKKN